MEHAKRMVLVDEKMMDSMLRKQDMSWKRPTEQSTKHGLSREMRLELDNQSIPEDVKAKLYQQTLSRFLNTKRNLPDEPSPSVINDLEKKKKKKRKKTWSFPTRHSKRKVKPPQKLRWEEW